MRNKIKERMAHVFQLENIADDISQSNCKIWDSMNHLNLIVDLENEFNVSLEPEDIADMKNLDLIEKIIIEKTKK